MKKFIMLGLLLVLASAAFAGEKAVTIEKVYAFPEKYAKDTLVFDKVAFAGSIVKNSFGYYSAAFKSADGLTIMDSFPETYGFGFAFPPKVAEQLVDDGVKKKTPARITATLSPLKQRATFWVATVIKLETLDKDGKVLKTYK